jgi:hypothetical protein
MGENMAKFKNFDEVRKAVEANDNLLVVQMIELREAHGASKLGVHVRREIADQLAGAGLGCFPEPENVGYQEENVRVFRRGTPIADVIDAVLRPSDFGDDRLREAAAGGGAEKLKQIRAIVCE